MTVRTWTDLMKVPAQITESLSDKGVSTFHDLGHVKNLWYNMFLTRTPDPPLSIYLEARDNNTLHTEPRAARLLKIMIFAAAR